MSEIACLQDIEDYAHKVLPKKALGYYRSGAGSETTVKNNRTAFTKLVCLYKNGIMLYLTCSENMDLTH